MHTHFNDEYSTRILTVFYQYFTNTHTRSQTVIFWRSQHHFESTPFSVSGPPTLGEIFSDSFPHSLTSLTYSGILWYCWLWGVLAQGTNKGERVMRIQSQISATKNLTHVEQGNYTCEKQATGRWSRSCRAMNQWWILLHVPSCFWITNPTRYFFLQTPIRVHRFSAMECGSYLWYATGREHGQQRR